MIIEANLTNVFKSVYKFLVETSYTRGIVTGTLQTHFTGLTTSSAYPQDLTQVVLPTIALSSPDEQTSEAQFMGETSSTQYDFSIYGFAGQSSQDDSDNLFSRDLMRNDIKVLLENSFIDLYDFDIPVTVGNMEIVNISSRNLPAISSQLQVERFKFVIDFSLIVLEKR